MALEDYGLLALRIALGIIFIYHGYPKIKNPKMMEQVFGNSTFPVVLGLFEFVSGLFILFGFLIQFAVIVTSIVMLGALYYKRGDFGSGKEILHKAKEMYDTPNVTTLLSFNKIGLGEYREVISLIEEKFGIKPKIYELRFILGVAYLKLDDDLRARELLLGLKDPALSEDAFFWNLKSTKIFNIDI